MGLWGRPAWLFLLLSLPVLSCLPIFFPLAVFTFNAFQVDLSSQGFLPLTLCLPQCLASGSDCTGSEPDPRPAPLYPDLSGVESESGLPPPAFLSPGSFFAHQPFSFCPFQVQLYVWHLLPLGKDLLHRVPTVLQAGGYPLQLPWSRVAGWGPGAWVCALERQPQGPGCPWMTGQQRQVSGQEDPAPGPPVGFPFTARHPLPDLLGMREHWRGVLRGTLAGAPGMSDAAPEQEVVPDTCSLHPSLSVCVRVRGSAWRF